MPAPWAVLVCWLGVVGKGRGAEPVELLGSLQGSVVGQTLIITSLSAEKKVHGAVQAAVLGLQFRCKGNFYSG